MTEQLNEQMKKYFEAKPEGDIDLIACVRDMLIRAGLISLTEMYYDRHPLILNSIGKTSSAQRFNLNRYWATQLMTVNKFNEEERYALIPNGTNQAWLELFQIKILPFIMENNLPTAI